MIDIHCHLLPEIDDGPSSVEASLALAKALVDDGITHVVMTPHVFPGRFENRASSILEEVAGFTELIEAAGIPLTLTWAGEVRLAPEVLPLQAKGELPFLGQHRGWKHMLLEMPDGQVPLGADRFCMAFLDQRVRPVIAHPERNRGVMENIDKLEPFIDMGCYLQVTAGSLVGQFGDKARSTARALLEREWVTVVASDAHNLAGRRPRMRDAALWLGAKYGAQVAAELTIKAPARLCGLELCADGRVVFPGVAAGATAGPATRRTLPLVERDN